MEENKEVSTWAAVQNQSWPEEDKLFIENYIRNLPRIISEENVTIDLLENILFDFARELRGLYNLINDNIMSLAWNPYMAVYGNIFICIEPSDVNEVFAFIVYDIISDNGIVSYSLSVWINPKPFDIIRYQIVRTDEEGNQKELVSHYVNLDE